MHRELDENGAFIFLSKEKKRWKQVVTSVKQNCVKLKAKNVWSIYIMSKQPLKYKKVLV